MISANLGFVDHYSQEDCSGLCTRDPRANGVLT